jgi:hypothetical protein
MIGYSQIANLLFYILAVFRGMVNEKVTYSGVSPNLGISASALGGRMQL